MNNDFSPYDPPVVATEKVAADDPVPSSNGVGYALAMFFAPVAAAISTFFANGMIMKTWPNTDVRYLCLCYGIPWTLTAWGVGIRTWMVGSRIVAVIGVAFWTLAGLFAAWVTLAFWHG